MLNILWKNSSSELLCSNGGIIRVPEGAEYTLKDIDEYVIAWSLPCFALPFLLPLCTFRRNRKTAQIRANWRALLKLGLFGGVLFGYLIFKEKGIRARLVGAIVMVFGVLFITLF